MKKLLSFLFVCVLLFGCSNNSDPEEVVEMSCGIYQGSINLRTPGEIAQFAACNYTEVTGTLGIFDGNVQNPITSLSALSSLERIGGRLSLVQLSALSNLDGLQNIESAAGISIHFTDLLENLGELDKLQTNSIELSNNASLRNIDALDMDADEIWTIGLNDNPLLESLNCFSNITSIRIALIIDNNDSLLDLSGLDNVENIGLNNITDCCGSLYIDGNQNLRSLSGLDKVTEINRRIWINDNFSLENTDGLNSLTRLTGDFYVSNNTFLDNINALQNLVYLDGDIDIIGNPSLRRFCGLQNLFLADGHDGAYQVFGNFFNPTPTNILNAPACD